MSVMIDLETAGTNSGSYLLSIGAQGFDDATCRLTDQYFYQEIYLPPSLMYNRERVNQDTIKWWEHTGPDFLRRCRLRGPHNVSLKTAVARFSRFVLWNKLSEDLFYCKGASFDFPLLEYWFTYRQFSTPWQFSNERCARTLYREYGFDEKSVPFDGTPHNALDDCRHQIKCLKLARGQC